jgi:hypothetical protein
MYEAFSAVNVTVFWNAVPCSLVDTYRHFGGTRFQTTMTHIIVHYETYFRRDNVFGFAVTWGV